MRVGRSPSGGVWLASPWAAGMAAAGACRRRLVVPVASDSRHHRLVRPCCSSSSPAVGDVAIAQGYSSATPRAYWHRRRRRADIIPAGPLTPPPLVGRRMPLVGRGVIGHLLVAPFLPSTPLFECGPKGKKNSRNGNDRTARRGLFF